MFLSLGFPIGTILFLLISLIMYIFKKKYHDFQNQLFRFLLSFTFILLFLEIAYINTMNNMDKIPVINEIVCRMFLVGIIIWVTTFFFYMLSVGMDKKTEEKYKGRIPTIMIVMCTILGVIDCLFKVEYMIGNGQFAIVGLAAYFVYGITGLLLGLLIIAIIKNKDHYQESLKMPLYFTLFLVLVDTAHLFVFEINDLTLLLSLIVSSLYFTVESQDRMLLKEVEDAKAKSESLDKAKTEFLSKMSHEIRTPMNTILGFSNSLLMDDNLTREKVLQDSKSINKASLNLLDLINNILELSRIESNKEALNEKDYKFADILKEINELIKSKTSENNIWYDFDINTNIPDTLHGDYQKVKKIITSLIINSIKYSTNGYLNVSVFYELKEEKDFIKVVITNSGSRMPEEYFNRDFSDFSKLDYGNDSKLDSEFLGLIIAKRFISMFPDSSIIFKEEKENTTKCILTLCQKRVGTGIISETILTKDISSKIDCSGKNALVVDDNDINLKLAEKLLKSYNFNVTKVSSGSECINEVKINNYDIIFLDHMMPDMDGIKTIEVLRNLNNKSLVIVAMTANSNTESEDFYKNKGFDGYISKPINKNRLDALIAKIFGGKL